jgi:crotonobetainyl-CoA:carnitine CoA-transferase CaiB-like acyl-CoA transferase
VHTVFQGVRVIEVAEWAMVPTAAAVLADFGADVIKVEPVARGDASRALAIGGGSPAVDGVSLVVEQANRGKRSIGLDLTTAGGREILYDLVRTADVVLTSFLPPAQEKLGVTYEKLREVKPSIIMARASGSGRRGDDAARPGYDSTVYWARAGLGYSLTTHAGPDMPRSRPGFGDRAASMNLAFGVAAALFRRERTGEGGTVDVSLLGTALWQIANDVGYTHGTKVENSKRQNLVPNPLSFTYATSDDRAIALGMLQSDRFWPDLCTRIGRQDLIADPRFVDSAARTENSKACVAELEAAFASQPLAVWLERLHGSDGPWEVVQTVKEVIADRQVRDNHFLRTPRGRNPESVVVVCAPVEFDEDYGYELDPAPEHGANTEEVLMELGKDWDTIGDLKSKGAVLLLPGPWPRPTSRPVRAPTSWLRGWRWG